MNKFFFGPIAFLPILLAGCAGQPITPLARTSPDNQGEVVIYRESSFIAGAVPLAVGADSNAFASIGNSEYVRALLAPGKHEIFVRARSAEPTRLNISVALSGHVCLKTRSSSDTIAKVLVPPVLMASGYHFDLEEVSCPSETALEKYTLVPVSYASE